MHIQADCRLKSAAQQSEDSNFLQAEAIHPCCPACQDADSCGTSNPAGVRLQALQHISASEGQQPALLLDPGVLTGLLHLLSQRHLRALAAWPKAFAGGSAGVAGLADAVLSLLNAPFLLPDLAEQQLIQLHKVGQKPRLVVSQNSEGRLDTCLVAPSFHETRH